ncbi:MAG: RNA polymerase subunit sigma-24 [Flavobacteriales bacterium]|nr:MAG: RNA polymerase subunit sigma-24 [Flavobacteriales bacterium]
MKTNLDRLFFEAKQNHRKAQKGLYDLYVGKMLAIALSYVKQKNDAEDIVLNAFYKAFTKINQCEKSQAFPSWLRRIVINDSISFIRKNKNILYVDTEVIENIGEEEEETFEDLYSINIKEILAEMPDGYRLVFNLYVFEEMKHKQIASVLNISEGTSKSQLSKAKKWLKSYFKNSKNEKEI